MAKSLIFLSSLSVLISSHSWSIVSLDIKFRTYHSFLPAFEIFCAPSFWPWRFQMKNSLPYKFVFPYETCFYLAALKALFSVFKNFIMMYLVWISFYGGERRNLSSLAFAQIFGSAGLYLSPKYGTLFIQILFQPHFISSFLEYNDMIAMISQVQVFVQYFFSLYYLYFSDFVHFIHFSRFSIVIKSTFEPSIRFLKESLLLLLCF